MIKKALAYGYNNIGIFHDLEGEDSLALAYYLKSMEIKKEIRADVKDVAATVGNIGSFHYSRKKYKEALPYFFEAIPMYLGDDNHSGAAMMYESIGQVYTQLDQIDSAKHYIDIATDYAKKSNSAIAVLNILDGKASFYEGSGDLQSALMAYKEIVTLKDSILNTENAKQLAEMQTKYETERKEKEIILLESKNAMQARTKNALIIGLVLIGVISVLLINILRLRAKKSKTDKQLVELELENAKNELFFKKQKLMDFTHAMKEKNELVEELKTQLDKRNDETAYEAKLENINQLVQSIILTEEDWKEFKKIFQAVHGNFFIKLKHRFPDLTNSEVRLAALMKLNLSGKEMANILGISQDSVTKTRYRLKKKMSLPNDTNIQHVINSF